MRVCVHHHQHQWLASLQRISQNVHIHRVELTHWASVCRLPKVCFEFVRTHCTVLVFHGCTFVYAFGGGALNEYMRVVHQQNLQATIACGLSLLPPPSPAHQSRIVNVRKQHTLLLPSAFGLPMAEWLKLRQCWAIYLTVCVYICTSTARALLPGSVESWEHQLSTWTVNWVQQFVRTALTQSQWLLFSLSVN